MPKIALLNVKGEKIKDIKLSDEVFGIEPNNQTIYDAVVLKQASMRQGTHKVKTRSKVSGRILLSKCNRVIPLGTSIC